MANCIHVTALLAATAALLVLQPTPSEALSCPPCNKQACKRIPMKCAYGLVKDPCGCCKLCGNGPNEPCGGEYMMLGECGKGLECRSNQASISPEFAEGICISKKPRVRSSPIRHRGGIPPGLKLVRRPALPVHHRQDIPHTSTSNKYPKQLI